MSATRSTVESRQLGGLSGHSLALVVDFTDGSQGIYLSLFSEHASYCTAGVSR